MRAIMVMFDSLNRRMLEPYGCEWVQTPNFARLARHSVTFDNNYAGSMPCMPARRELHTGRYNFLHRSWGPIEPFDDSMPEMLHMHGVASHLASDHYHYWEDGGCTYHTRYSNWRFSRGQEGDPWWGDLAPRGERAANLARLPSKGQRGLMVAQDNVNREHIREEAEWPQAKTFQMGLDFLEANVTQDNWFLHIETFDPHEPYYAPEHYCARYPDDYDGPAMDWPAYKRTDGEDPRLVEQMQANAAPREQFERLGLSRDK